jgi:hypothetical protein
MINTVHQEQILFNHVFYRLYHSLLIIPLWKYNFLCNKCEWKGTVMKTIITLTIIVLIFLVTKINATESAETDSAQSVFYGLYGTYPILSKEKKLEIVEKKKDIEMEIKVLEDSIVAIDEKISNLHKTDTVTVRKHMIIFRGMFTIPVLTDAEKQKKKKLDPLKKEMIEVQEHKTDLEQKLVEIKELLIRDKKYFEKRILWGFIVWEVER